MSGESDIREKFGYTILAEPEENKVKFSIVDECNNAVCDGHIKWDGCSNWHFVGAAHFCGKSRAIEFGVLIGELYDWAVELMPQHKQDIEG